MDEPIMLSTMMRIRDGIQYKLIESKKSGRNKLALEGFHSYSFSCARGKLVQHQREIDRANNRYYELVSDPDTGEVIHRCEERLSEHRGHGSALKRTPNQPFERTR